jgi:hypothetical protein
MVGPALPFRIARRSSYRAVPLDPVELSDPRRGGQSELARVLRELSPELLIVDLFWAPLRRLLPIAGCEAWLLVRRVPPVWFKGPPILPYERSLFARVLGIEPGAADGYVDETIDPIVLANPDECRPREALRDALGVAANERLVVVHQAGNAGEAAALAASADDAFFPLCEWLGGADTIVSGAGYNAFWEARRLGYAARSTFVPFTRALDDQAWRVRECSSQVPAENGADVLARRIVRQLPQK